MSDQVLQPFKAKFILEVKTNSKDFFEKPDNQSLEVRLSKVADELGNSLISELIKYYYLSSKTYQEYKNLHFKYNKAFDVSPHSMTVDSRDFDIHFKLESYPIEVLQIIENGTQITFSESDGEVKTISKKDNLKLIRVQ